jgi:cytochrome c-type biogenesis protein CcmE
MMLRRMKFWFLGAGVALSMAFLIAVGVNRGGVYYLTVSEFLGQTPPPEGDFRVNGTVVSGSIERLPSGMEVRFVMTDGSRSVPVRYHGIVPDTFVDQAAVVVEGRLVEDGTFVAHKLLAKCPSKYEAADEPPAVAGLEAAVR